MTVSEDLLGGQTVQVEDSDAVDPDCVARLPGCVCVFIFNEKKIEILR